MPNEPETDETKSSSAEQPAVPERRTIMEATGIAAGVALVVLVLVVLPAEYGIDPTGFGGLVGFTDLSEPTVTGNIHTIETALYREDAIPITVNAQSGLEFKYRMFEGSGFVYNWSASGDLYFEFHGEPNGDTSGYFESYELDTRSHGDGLFQAPFDGSHGWYFRNDSFEPVTVTITTAGHYEIIGPV